MQAERGFTLIELLIVIAVLGVLSVGVLTAVNVTSQINKANLAKVETFDASIQNSLSIDLVGEWKLDQETTIPGPPVKVKDTSGYGNDGTVTGATLTTDRKGQANKAYSFNGDSTLIDNGTNLTLNFSGNHAYTISAWAYLDGYVSQGSILNSIAGWGAGGAAAGQTGATLNINSSNKAVTVRSDGTGTAESVSGLTNVQGGWHHFIATYNGTTLKLYVDAVVEGTPVASSRSLSGTAQSFRIGRDGDANRNFDGSVDDVRIYSQALTASNIQQLYAQGLKKHQLARN